MPQFPSETPQVQQESAEVIGTLHFDDLRIDDITSGRTPMTAAEREYLLADTLRFEECLHSETELKALDDIALMKAAYGAWADYASGQV